MQAIETIYKGYKFRSRLEARWAVFFDSLGIQWEYEPEGYVLEDGTLYLPDFWLPEWNCFAEVKPKIFTEGEFRKCIGLNKLCILLDTSSPETYRGYYATNSINEDIYSDYIYEDNYGRVLLEVSSLKKRLWFLLGESPQDYYMDSKAETMAKSARFEHGEQP